MQPLVTCRVRGPLPYAVGGILVLTTLVAIPYLAVSVLRGTWPLLATVPIALVLVWGWYFALFRFVYEVRLLNGRLVARSLLRTRTVDVSDVTTVGSGRMKPNVVSIRTRSTTVDLARPVDNLFELATRLREMNPAQILSVCTI